jgi:DnaJ-class molecular chaperone
VNYYEILGLDHHATQSRIAHMYRKLAMAYRPDRNPTNRNAASRFKAITKAFETLNNPRKRAQYDSQQGFNAEVLLAEVVATEQTSSMWYTPGKQSKRQKWERH